MTLLLIEYYINKKHRVCEIEYLVETHLDKLCVILRSRVSLGVCPHQGYRSATHLETTMYLVPGSTGRCQSLENVGHRYNAASHTTPASRTPAKVHKSAGFHRRSEAAASFSLLLLALAWEPSSPGSLGWAGRVFKPRSRSFDDDEAIGHLVRIPMFLLVGHVFVRLGRSRWSTNWDRGRQDTLKRHCCGKMWSTV